MIDVAFIYLYIVVDKKARSWKSVPQAKTAREETVKL